MSAIFGVCGCEGSAAAGEAVRRMDSALATYGPHGAGSWTSDDAALGQRLWCFTPQDRHEIQPRIEEDAVLISAGRVDSRLELRYLLPDASEWDDIPDSSYLLAAYRKWGTDFPLHVTGSYSAIVWDRTLHRLFAVRSAWGGPSVYYHRDGERLSIASRPKALFALPHIPRSLNLERLADFLAAGGNDPGRSFFAGISFLEPGSTLVFERGKLTVESYWERTQIRETRFQRDEDYIAALNDLLERVVADHMRAITPVGVMMSGGLDSGSVAAVAAHLAGRNGEQVHTFTAVPYAGRAQTVPPGRYADETERVQAIAALWPNLNTHFLPESGRFHLDGMHRYLDAANYPFRNISNRPWWEDICGEAAQLDIRVLLTGVPGNFTLTWDGKPLITELVRNGRWLDAWRESAAQAHNGENSSRWHALISHGIMPFLPDPFWHVLNRVRKRHLHIPTHEPWRAYSPMRSAFAHEQRVEERSRARGESLHFRPIRDARLSRYSGLRHSALMSDMELGYKELYGVEMRHPLTDTRLAEFCLSLPVEQFRRNGQSRLLVKRSMASKLPPQILAGNRRGAQAVNWYDTLYRSREKIRAEIDAMESSPLAAHALDIPRLRALEAAMLPPESAGDARVSYRTILDGGLLAGSFIRWFESRSV